MEAWGVVVPLFPGGEGVGSPSGLPVGDRVVQGSPQDSGVPRDRSRDGGALTLPTPPPHRPAASRSCLGPTGTWRMR